MTAEGDEVVGFMGPVVVALLDVVGLEPVAAPAAFDRALPLVAPEDVGAEVGWDGFS